MSSLNSEPADQDTGLRDVLELRVHGVKNTSPQAMLDLASDAIEQVLGDDLAGFWRPKRPEGANGPGDRGRVPPGITREAYSWGGLDRTSPGGGTGTIGKVTALLGKVGWALLLPFGLANVGYWSRRLDDGAGRQGDEVGASVVRLFGLALTAFAVVTASEVSMDLVATQCYVASTRVCTGLPAVFDGLDPAPTATRLAVLSVVPIALLLGLWILSSISRSRYERAISPANSAGQLAGPATPVLAAPEMWSGDWMVTGLVHTHLTAGLATVGLALAWPAVFDGGSACAGPRDLFSATCVGQVLDDVPRFVVFGLFLLVSALLLVAACVITVGRRTDAPDIAATSSPSWAQRTRALVVVTGLVLAGTEAAMLIMRPALHSNGRPLGASGFPTAVLAVLLGLVAWAFFLRLSSAGALWGALVTAGVIALVFTPWAAIPLGIVMVLLLLHLARARGGGQRPWEAWSGTGPGMTLGAALQAQLLLACLLTVGMGDWLNGANGAGSLVGRGEATATAATALRRDPCGALCPGQDPVLTVPLPYLLLGTASVLAALLTGAMLLIAAIGWRAQGPTGTAESETQKAVRRARAFARVAHRAEKVFGVLVGIGLSLTLLAVAASAGGWITSAGLIGPTVWSGLVDFTTGGIALLALATLGALIKGAATGTKRPLGLVWDLVAFLPRAAHPFAPPCYAERAVPELTQRIHWWLAQPDRVVGRQIRGGRRLVISAHSLGGVLAVAALMRPTLAANEAGHQVRLLTYGSQLRAYFSRIFPELLGPAVLGTPFVRSAALFGRDPWRTEKAATRPAPPTSHASIVGRLTDDIGGRPLWRNLWRRTDFLGFPVWSYEEDQARNPVDVQAAEVDRTGYLLAVLTHGDYPRTPEYIEELERLSETPPDVDPGGSPPA